MGLAAAPSFRNMFLVFWRKPDVETKEEQEVTKRHRIGVVDVEVVRPVVILRQEGGQNPNVGSSCMWMVLTVSVVNTFKR